MAEAPIMAFKCANPKCSVPFRYRYVGRIFRLRFQPAAKRGVPRDREMRVEYFWLCASCSSAFTLIFDERRGVGLAPFGDRPDHKRNFTVIFDITALRSYDHAADSRGVGAEAGSRAPRRKCREVG